MTREEILKSPELSKVYTREYAALLRLTNGKDVARVAACANVTALALSQERPVTREVLERVGPDRLREVLARAGSLDELRGGLDWEPSRAPGRGPLSRLLDEHERAYQGLER